MLKFSFDLFEHTNLFFSQTEKEKETETEKEKESWVPKVSVYIGWGLFIELSLSALSPVGSKRFYSWDCFKTKEAMANFLFHKMIVAFQKHLHLIKLILTGMGSLRNPGISFENLTVSRTIFSATCTYELNRGNLLSKSMPVLANMRSYSESGIRDLWPNISLRSLHTSWGRVWKKKLIRGEELK